MHNTTTRIQSLFSTSTSLLSFLALIIAALSLLTTPSPTLPQGTLKLHNVQVVKGRPSIYSQVREEYAHIKFDLDIDLSDLFTWNTKQVFLYVTASYPPHAFTRPSPDGEEEQEPSPDLQPPDLESPYASHGSELNTQSIIWDAVLPHSLSPSHPNQYRYPTVKPPKPPPKPKNRKVSAKSVREAQKAEAAALAAAHEAARQQPGILRLAGQRPKYQITDPSGRLARRANATLELSWNVQPWVGFLTWGSGSRSLMRSSSGIHAVEVGREGDEEMGGAGKEVERKLQAVMSWVTDFRSDGLYSTWRAVRGKGARTAMFGLPALRDSKEAARKAGEKDELKVEKGKEKNRLLVG